MVPKAIDPADFYFLVQTLVGAWPSAPVDEAFVARIAQWCEKYLREAKLRSWATPAVAYEDAFKAQARELVSG